MAKQIKPEDFNAPESVTGGDTSAKKTTPQEVVDNSSLAALVQSQSRLIERLEEKLNAMAKVVPTTSTMSPQEEMRKIEEASKTQKQLLVETLKAQPQLAMMIPLGINEKPGATHEVGINGVVFVYPKGQMITVPQTVFDLLSAHFNITSSAGREMRIDRDDRVTEALS